MFKLLDDEVTNRLIPFQQRLLKHAFQNTTKHRDDALALHKRKEVTKLQPWSPHILIETVWNFNPCKLRDPLRRGPPIITSAESARYTFRRGSNHWQPRALGHESWSQHQCASGYRFHLEANNRIFACHQQWISQDATLHCLKLSLHHSFETVLPNITNA